MSAKLVLNGRGIREFLRSSEVLRDLEARANRIAARAGAGMRVETRQKGKQRARAAVITNTPQARVAEARNRVLTKSLDAGRDH